MAKYYAVKNGRKPGIYSSWDECKKQVEKFKGAIYKSFTSLEDAKVFIKEEKKMPVIHCNHSFFFTRKSRNRINSIQVFNK